MQIMQTVAKIFHGNYASVIFALNASKQMSHKACRRFVIRPRRVKISNFFRGTRRNSSG
jgi:hypothetical protein